MNTLEVQINPERGTKITLFKLERFLVKDQGNEKVHPGAYVIRLVYVRINK